MASSPALPTQGATEEVTRKREVRLMKNRYVLELLLFFRQVLNPLRAEVLTQVLSALQGSRSGMPPEEEGVRQVSGKPSGRPGEPKQDANRGTQSP